ncbi:MAG: DUF2520 domain-containing protein [Paramuribaculum sp.]|nr:DUF2520 domain-containing protein [Paramuribaculum sp.]
MKPLRTTIVGAGNVAWSLAPALERGGMIKVARVVARTHESADALARRLGPYVEATTDNSLADHDVDLVIVATTDSAVRQIAETCPGSQAVWVHTSGSVDASELATASPRYGVLYPMQTFTRGVEVDLSHAAIYIEASSESLLAQLKAIALTVSDNVGEADSDGRKRLHCAAVFACNFTNHLLTIAEQVAGEAGRPLSDFRQLIDETLRKAALIGPYEGQTGPARRGATEVMEAHEALLSPQLRNIYHILSESIASTYSNESH